MAEDGGDNGWQQGAQAKVLSSDFCLIYHLDTRSPLRLWSPQGMNTFCGSKDNQPLGFWVIVVVVLFWLLSKVCCLYPLVHSVSLRPRFVSEHLPTGKYAHRLHGHGR